MFRCNRLYRLAKYESNDANLTCLTAPSSIVTPCLPTIMVIGYVGDHSSAGTVAVPIARPLKNAYVGTRYNIADEMCRWKEKLLTVKSHMTSTAAISSNAPATKRRVSTVRMHERCAGA